MAGPNEERVGQLSWTSEKPKQSGFYFYRQSSDEDPILVRVDMEGDRTGNAPVVWLHGDDEAESLEGCHGDWSGPIEPPP